jgi:hypothetical protein
MPDHVQIDVREVRYLVRSHGGIYDSRPVNGECLADGGIELTRFPRCETVSVAGACESSEVRIRKFDAFAKWRQADA